jgi:hypothetical protein
MLDPSDEESLSKIRGLYGTAKISPTVSTREDILATIEQFYREKEAAASRPSEPDSAPEPVDTSSLLRENRRNKRRAPSIPEFMYVEFSRGASPDSLRDYKLNVVDYSGGGFGLLVTGEDEAVLKGLRPGDVLENITFYATWTLIRVDVRVAHITSIKKGKHKGCTLLGVKSKEIIESSRIG